MFLLNREQSDSEDVDEVFSCRAALLPTAPAIISPGEKRLAFHEGCLFHKGQIESNHQALSGQYCIYTVGVHCNTEHTRAASVLDLGVFKEL